MTQFITGDTQVVAANAPATAHSLKSFFEILWPGLPPLGHVSFLVLPLRRAVHLPLEQIATMTDDDLADMHATNERGQNIYFGLGLRCPGLSSYRVGRTKDVVAIPAFAVDIALYRPGAHRAENLPMTRSDVDNILSVVPSPSLEVSTGHGLHSYWQFPEPRVIANDKDRYRLNREYKAFQARIIHHAGKLGFHVDRTASIQRVWRLPGFRNAKEVNRG